MKSVFALVMFLAAGGPASAEGLANTNPRLVQAGSYNVEPNHTRVQFNVSHMGFTTWTGDFTSVGGALTLDPAHLRGSHLEIAIPTASVTTTNAKLDGELKSADWLDAVHYPKIFFISNKIVRTAQNKANIYGYLTLHGVTHLAVLAASFNGAGVNPMNKKYTIGFDATTKISRSTYGVTKYVPLIGDATLIRISAAFEKN